MSISSAISSSLTGLQTVEKQITVSSGNIANAKTPGYARQRADLGTQVVDGNVAGVSVTGISAEVNENIVTEIRNQSASLAEKNTAAAYFSRIETLYGDLNGSPTLSDRINGFFSGMQNLSNDPELLSLRQSAVSGADDAANYISNLAQELYDLQYEVDRELGSAVDTVNGLLENLHDINGRISEFEKGTSGYTNIQMSQREALRELSEYIPISIGQSGNGAVSIAGPEGVALLDSRLYKLDYTPSLSPEVIVGGADFRAITVTALDESGTPQGTSIDLVTSGVGQEVQYGGDTGKIKGLLDLRDGAFPELVNQLDQLAFTFKESVNKEHNNGVSFPPPSELSGTRAVAPNDLLGFEGSVRIAVLQPDGSPAYSPFGDEEYFTPLTLDFDKLNTGEGAGKFDMDALVKEINSHYGPPQNRASVGNLRNVGLVLQQDGVADAGSAKFTLEYDNVSAQNANVEIVSVSVVDPVDGSSGYGAVTPPSGSFTAEKGGKSQHDDGFIVNFSGDDNRDNYNVNVTVRVTDENGNVSESVITYNVGDDVDEGSYNDRYAATAQSVTSGDGDFYGATGMEFLRASYLNEDGGAVQPDQQGYLTLSAGAGLRIAISELDSAHTSLNGVSKDGTGKGFSGYFGLNDLFESKNPDEAAGTAISLKVRDDIAENPNRLAVGRLSPSAQPLDDSLASYTYEVGAGDNGTARALASVGNSVLSFGATRNFPETSVSISTYSATVISFMATKAEKAQSDQEIEQFAFEGLQELFQEDSGVDIDEELAKILELESQYAASATLISTLRSMLDTLRGAFR